MGLTKEFVNLTNQKYQTTTTTTPSLAENSSPSLQQQKQEEEDLTSLIEKTTSSPLISSVPFGFDKQSSRTEFLQWQRRELTHVRKEVVLGRSDKKNNGGSVNDNNAIGDYYSGNSGGRMTMLINKLPSLKKKMMKNSNIASMTLGETPSTRLQQSESSSSMKLQQQKQQQQSIEDGPTMTTMTTNPDDPTPIATTLKTLERDMSLLDNLVSSKIALSKPELSLLIGAIIASGMGPIAFPGTSVTELLAPAAAAFTASITIGSEYLGRVAVADGKEIAANTIQCAAEAEALLASAERVKAITPLCVGVGATCASFALLTPTIVEAFRLSGSVQLMTELYILCPLVSVLAAAVANLALEETREFAGRAINVGVRRFAKSGSVGRTWMSTSEQIQKGSKLKTTRWWSFAWSVLPAPIIGSVVGGPTLSTKCIIVAALAAAQSAYFLALAESVVARAQDAVALKARSAAVCDTYANQGARNAAILPFTSALSAFCAAATAAAVELPIIDTVSSLYGTLGEVALVSTFPILSSAFAAAAAVSKARCEVDAEAACQAASTLALEYDGMDGSGDDPVLRPFLAVRELITLAVVSGWRSVKRGIINPLNNVWQWSKQALWRLRWRNIKGQRWISGGEGMA